MWRKKGVVPCTVQRRQNATEASRQKLYAGVRVGGGGTDGGDRSGERCHGYNNNITQYVSAMIHGTAQPIALKTK